MLSCVMFQLGLALGEFPLVVMTFLQVAIDII